MALRSVSTTVLAFTMLLSLIAMQTSRTDLNVTLKETGSHSGSGLRQNKARGILVGVEMVLAIVLLVGAGPERTSIRPPP
jgi:hypothetical protein